MRDRPNEAHLSEYAPERQNFRIDAVADGEGLNISRDVSTEQQGTWERLYLPKLPGPGSDDACDRIPLGPSLPGSRRRMGSVRNFVLILLAMGVAAAVYLYTHPEDWKRVRRELPIIGSDDVTRAYKWRDAQGRWQVTDQPPTGGLAFEVLEFSDDVNVLPLPPKLDEPAR